MMLSDCEDDLGYDMTCYDGVTCADACDGYTECSGGEDEDLDYCKGVMRTIQEAPQGF